MPAFFRLMCASAGRQHQAPNPSRIDLLETLWDASPSRLHLAFAEHEGQKRAGLLMIEQGERVVFWKKGWDGEQPRVFANLFLMVECLTWAAVKGFREADMGGMSPGVAGKMLAGDALNETQGRSRDVFNLRLGARAKRLPPAQLLVTNRVLAPVVYRILGWDRLRAAFERRAL